ncbi:MAG: hypothetical protein QOH47_2451 [Sphingomonadales bacterium]|jgi:hypothetical protein|nr:hypothetical protein [Sphingomonadales bacterium]
MGNSGRIQTRQNMPAWVQTVGAMLAEGCEVRAMCQVCRRWEPVDLAKIAAAKGPDYSLIDRRSRCRFTPGCKGWVRFAYLLGVFRPLWTTAAAERWMRGS